MRDVEWMHLSAAALREAAGREDAAVILPVASVEQHGPHLATGVDAILVGEVARRAARAVEGVVVAPTVWMGLAEHHMPFGGTFTLSLDTYRAVLGDLSLSVARHGFHRVLILNGHGGNVTALKACAHELQDKAGIALAVATYWEVAAERFEPILERQNGVRHACEAETSMMLALRPDLVSRELMETADGPTDALDPAGGVLRWRPINQWTTNGVVGAPSAASAEKGERLLNAAGHAVAERLRELAIWDGA